MNFHANKTFRLRGVALVYALLASVSFITFFTALVFQMQGTLFTLRSSEDLIKAKALAALGNDVVYDLLRQSSIDWQGNLPFRFSNEPGPDYFRGVPAGSGLETSLSKKALGGTFLVELREADDVSGLDVPDGGTYLVAVCRGKVNNRETQLNDANRIVLKMGSPYLNNLATLEGNLRLGVDGGVMRLAGPVYVNQDKNGAGGNIDFIAHRTNAAGTHALKEQVFASGNFRAQGKISVVNDTTVVQPLGRETLSIGETKIVPSHLPIDPNHAWKLGGIGSLGGLSFDPDIQLGLELEDGSEILESISSVAGVIDIDLGTVSALAPSRGVLVEIEDEQVRICDVDQAFYGRLYDLGVWYGFATGREASGAMPTSNLTHATGTSFAHFWLFRVGGPTVAAYLGLRECFWDDPAFPNATIPSSLIAAAALVDVDGDGNPEFSPADIPTTGDYIDYFRPARRSVLQTHTLNRDDFTVLRFHTDGLTSTTEAGEPTAPTVFVRGRVKGKLLLTYELTGAATDPATWAVPNEPFNSICVLGEDGGSVPGGITLADPNVQADPAALGPFSKDMCLLATNGRVTAGSEPVFFQSWLAGEPAPGRLLENHAAWSVPSVYEVVRPHRDTTCPPGDLDREWWTRGFPEAHSGLPVEFYAASIGGGSRMSARLGPTGRRAPYEPGSSFVSPYFWQDNVFKWNLLPSLDPLLVVTDPLLMPLSEISIPRAMRRAMFVRSSRLRTYGAHGQTKTGSDGAYPGGYHTYDYRWRALEARSIIDSLGLAVTPMLIERRGY